MTQLPALGSVVADKYQIESLLGEGGMGAVFRAQHLLMERPVALKWLRPELAQNPEARDRFLREARAAGRIHHPNVVDVYDVGVHKDSLFMVMEMLEGEHFEELLLRGDTPTARLLDLLVGAMHGVAAAHRQGIVHRDIKPENLFVVSPSSGDPRIKVLDFGISKLVDEVPKSARWTQAGTVVGTPLFMSFEQLSGAADVDARADVYSFGVLLYRVLTGVIPFDAESVAAIAVLIATYRPPSPKRLRPELPEALADLVMKSMAYDRDDRFGSMEELIAALTSLDESHGILGRSSERERDRAVPGAPLVAAGAPDLALLDMAAPIGPAGSVLPVGGASTWLRLGGAVAILCVLLAGFAWLFARASTPVVAQRRGPPLPAASADVGQPLEARPPLTPAPIPVRTDRALPLTPSPMLTPRWSAPAPPSAARPRMQKPQAPRIQPVRVQPLRAPAAQPLRVAPPTPHRVAPTPESKDENSGSPARKLLRRPDF
ncbi:MAG: protein kinase [Polyangiales bacterium]